MLAISPTIGVSCTPKVMARWLCATHIIGAILIGNQAADLVLKTSLPVDIDVDVMLAMAAVVHVEAAAVITERRSETIPDRNLTINSGNPAYAFLVCDGFLFLAFILFFCRRIKAIK